MVAAVDPCGVNQAVHALAFDGDRFDCGSKLGYLKATVSFGLSHPDEGDAFRKYLSDLLST